MKPAGSLIAHGRKWKLYGRRAMTPYGVVMKIFLSHEDQTEKERLDKQALKHKR